MLGTSPGPGALRIRGVGRVAALLAVMTMVSSPVAGDESPRLRAGAIEIGVAGSLTSVEGSTRSTVALRGGGFVRVFSGLGGLEAEVGYHHERSLNALDAEGAASWQRAVAGRGLYPFVALGGGVREEKLGSFSQARYPVGFAFGARLLASSNAAFHLEYRYRRVLHDPVANFTEHQVLTGISLLLRNAPRPDPGAREGH